MFCQVTAMWRQCVLSFIIWRACLLEHTHFNSHSEPGGMRREEAFYYPFKTTKKPHTGCSIKQECAQRHTLLNHIKDSHKNKLKKSKNKAIKNSLDFFQTFSTTADYVRNKAVGV